MADKRNTLSSWYGPLKIAGIAFVTLCGLALKPMAKKEWDASRAVATDTTSVAYFQNQYALIKKDSYHRRRMDNEDRFTIDSLGRVLGHAKTSRKIGNTEILFDANGKQVADVGQLTMTTDNDQKPGTRHVKTEVLDFCFDGYEIVRQTDVSGKNGQHRETSLSLWSYKEEQMALDSL